MKDCKWNPPTAGSKGLHFTEDGKLLTRAELAELEPGTKVYKFLDESGERTTRRKAQRQLERLLAADTQNADLPLEYRPAWPTEGNWVVHTRSDDDKLSAEANLALALGIPRYLATNVFFRSQYMNAHAKLTSPENAAATAELINMHRNGELTKDLLGGLRSRGTGPVVPGLASREEALMTYLSRETAITDFLNALPVARALTTDRRAQVIFALNAGHHADALARLPEELRDTALDLFINQGLNAATLDGVKVLGRPEDILRRLVESTGGGVMMDVTVTRLTELSQMLSQTGLSSRFVAPRFQAVVGEYSLPEVLEYSGSFAGKRALGLAITTARVISDSGDSGAIRDLAASARNSRLVENPLTSQLCQVQAALTDALKSGKLAVDASPVMVRQYLENPSDPIFDTPRIALASHFSSSKDDVPVIPVGYIDMAALRPPSQSPDTASIRTALFDVAGPESCDGVMLTTYVTPVDIATVSTIALKRAHGTVSTEQLDRADKISANASLAEIARDALSEITAGPSGYEIPDMVLARLAMNEKCRGYWPPSQELVEQVTSFITTGSGQVGDADQLQNLSAIKQLAAIRDGSKPETWQAKSTRLDVADTQTLRDCIAADGLLARLRAEVLAEPAVAYLRPSDGLEREIGTSVVIALAPSTDPAKVTALLQQRFPLSEGAIQVRNEEVVVSVNILTDPFRAASQIEEALAAL